MDKILPLYFKETRSRVDGRRPVLYRVDDVMTCCRNSLSAAKSNVLENKLEMEYNRVSQLTRGH